MPFTLTSTLRPTWRFASLALLGALCLPTAHAADPEPDADALSLVSAPVESAASGVPRTKFFVEGAVGTASPRADGSSKTLARVSADLNYATEFAPGWRAAISDRLDSIRPRQTGTDATVNSLREAFVSWQQADAKTAVDLGRMNLRYGPGYGYNPTDFFRDGALRTVTSTDPLSLRENRLGTVVLRGQRLWAGGSVSAAFAPKLADAPSSNGASLDLGATNNRDRGLIVLGSQLSDRVSTQLLLYKERDLPATLGASMTALVTDAAVAYVEATRGREPDLLGRATGIGTGPQSTRNRFVGGVTYTTSTSLSVTAEYQYNGFALDGDAFNALAMASPAGLGAYLGTAASRQELASRQAYLLYATQKNLFVKNLDLTALLRVNAADRSNLVWVELRRHWTQIDLALQLQQQSGRDVSEYALYPYRRSAQLLASYFF